MSSKVAEATIVLLLCTRISGAHAWRSSITPIDQLLCQAGQLLMSCEKRRKKKPQWNKSQYQANKLLIGVWGFYVLACSYTWQGLKGARLRKEVVRLWLFNYLIFMSSSVVCVATAGLDGLSSVLNAFEGSFLFVSDCWPVFVSGEKLFLFPVKIQS